MSASLDSRVWWSFYEKTWYQLYPSEAAYPLLATFALSYIAGALRGDPGLNVQIRNRKTGHRHAVAANIALTEASLPCHPLGAKEALAIVNGTAVSAGIAALALHDAHGLAVISQVFTAMSVEALQGSLESFDHFFG